MDRLTMALDAIHDSAQQSVSDRDKLAIALRALERIALGALNIEQSIEVADAALLKLKHMHVVRTNDNERMV